MGLVPSAILSHIYPLMDIEESLTTFGRDIYVRKEEEDQIHHEPILPSKRLFNVQL